jgi:DNA-binding response OmpR family regulator
MQKMNHLEKLNILYLEDEDIIRNNVSTMLQYLFNEVYATSSVSDALLCFETKKVHIILSDISMPGKNGLDFIEQLRLKKINIPVILLTAHTDTDFLLKATKLKLVDYLTKPVNFTDLKNALAKAGEEYFENNSLIINFPNNIKYDFNKKLLFENNITKDITAKELQLLEFLYENKNRVVSKEEIQNAIWEDSFNATESAFKSLLNKLRNKIGKQSIKNISGVGYQLIINEQEEQL